MRIFGNNKHILGYNWFKLLQFGAPFIQDEIKNELKNTSEFENFQTKLTEDTGKSYSELKEFWIIGEPVEEKHVPKILYTTSIKYIIIHLDSRKKEYIGFINENAEVYENDGEYYILITEPPEVIDFRKSPVIARPIVNPEEEMIHVFQSFFQF